MDQLIQDIISVDHACAQAVEDAKQKKSDTSAHMNAKKKDVYDSLMAEYSTTIETKKQELQASIDETKKKNDEKYKASLDKLSSMYETHKDEWVAKIVENAKA